MQITPLKNLPALRHLAYEELLTLLPPASVAQASEFLANLAICRLAFKIESTTGRNAEIRRITGRYLNLKVSPDIATATNYRRPSVFEIEDSMFRSFGDLLDHVAGFYKTNRWRLNLPERCAFFGYQNVKGFYSGILCQPLDSADKYFLLSSYAKGGPKAVPLSESTKEAFERFKEPAELRHIQISGISADLSGWKVRSYGNRIKLIEPQRATSK